MRHFESKRDRARVAALNTALAAGEMPRPPKTARACERCGKTHLPTGLRHGPAGSGAYEVCWDCFWAIADEMAEWEQEHRELMMPPKSIQ